jgi:hypothetical protein
MSLILDALKKLEREKGAGDPGVVVVGTVPWGAADPGRRRMRLLLAATLALGLVTAGGWWLLLRLRPTPAATVAPLATAPVASAPLPVPLAPTPATAPGETTHIEAPQGPETGPAAPAAVPAPHAGAAIPAAVLPDTETPSTPAPTTPAAGLRNWPELHLSAISVRDGRPIALVNDRLVREGDSFDGVSIIRIGDAEVEVEFRGERHVLRF